MMNFLSRIRRLREVIVSNAIVMQRGGVWMSSRRESGGEESAGVEFTPNTANLLRRKSRIKKNSGHKVVPVRPVRRGDRSGDSKLDLASFRSDLDAMLESMSVSLASAPRRGSDFENAGTSYDIGPTTEDDVAEAVRKLWVRLA
jgi:hypothetical protein